MVRELRIEGKKTSTKMVSIFEFIRRKNGLNQIEFAEKLGIVQSTVSKIEKGYQEPDYKTLKNFCKNFEVDFNDVINNEGKVFKVIYNEKKEDDKSESNDQWETAV